MPVRRKITGGIVGYGVQNAITWGFKRGAVVSSNTGAGLVGEAFGTVFGSFGGKFVAIAILLFAFSTVLGWSHYGATAWLGFDLDMNRTFPGTQDGTMPELVAHEILEDIKGADVCIDIHASNIFLREIPQIRMSVPTSQALLPYAKMLNVDFVWVHAAATVLESTLAYSLNSAGTKTFGDPAVKSLCVMGAMRGNEVAQMYVCARLVKKLKRLEVSGQIEKDRGIMIIPCANYHSMNIGKRFWAMGNTDINRMFPGYDMGETTQRIADGIFSQIQGYEYGIQLASFYQPGRFLTHVKQMTTEFSSDDGLADFGLAYALRRKPRPYDTTTLNYNWQLWGTKAYSLFTHSTDDMNEDSTGSAVNAILRFMQNRGIIRYPIYPGFKTSIINEENMMQLHSPCGGICRIRAKIGDVVEAGQVLAEILNPLTCERLCEIKAPEKSTIFFHFSSPLIVEGTVVFKLVLERTSCRKFS